MEALFVIIVFLWNVGLSVVLSKSHHHWSFKVRYIVVVAMLWVVGMLCQCTSDFVMLLSLVAVSMLVMVVHLRLELSVVLLHP